VNTPIRNLVILLLTVCACTAIASDSLDVPFKSIAARAAAAKYQRAVEQVERDQQRQLEQARVEYAQALTDAQADATRRGSLDEAVRIRDAIDALKAGAATTKPLDARLTGTRWAWHKDGRDTGVRVVFSAGGVYHMVEPDGTKRLGRWRSVSIAHVEAVSPDGTAVEFTFNHAADTFMAIADGGALRIGHRMP
jgi:hypothetical protein